MPLLLVVLMFFVGQPCLAEEGEVPTPTTVSHREFQVGGGAFQWLYRENGAEVERAILPAAKFGVLFDDPAEDYLIWGQIFLGFGSVASTGTSPLGVTNTGSSGAAIHFSPEGHVAYKFLKGEGLELQAYGGITLWNSYRKVGGSYWELSNWTLFKVGLRAAVEAGDWSFALMVGPNVSLFSQSTHYLSSQDPLVLAATFVHKPGFGYNVELPIAYRISSSTRVRVVPYWTYYSRGTSFEKEVVTSTATIRLNTPGTAFTARGVFGELTFGF